MIRRGVEEDGDKVGWDGDGEGEWWSKIVYWGEGGEREDWEERRPEGEV